MSIQVKNVIVIGASGGIGPSIVNALLAGDFNVSVLTRSSSSATFPPDVTIYRSDYTPASLFSAFSSQDAVVSTIATWTTNLQLSIFDAAIKAGVKRFVPSEYGIDTSLDNIPEYVPPAVPKRDTIKYLQTKEMDGISWTAVCVGVFYDWSFGFPGLMGWDLKSRTALIFDGGNIEYEATNLEQIGLGVAAILSKENLQETANQYVYINSFTLTQNKVLATLERLTGDEFEVKHATTKELTKTGQDIVAKTVIDPSVEPTGYAPGSTELITAAIYGSGALNNFSKTKGLWNEKLGLAPEDFEECMVKILKDYA